MAYDEAQTSPNGSMTHIMVRPLGSPLPLGCFAFGVGTVLLAALELKWVPARESETFSSDSACLCRST
jgi:succinate-acetate transporter protein